MEDHSQDVMVALLPMTTDWSKETLPHLTLVYAGDMANLKPSDMNELGKTASSIAKRHRPIQLFVIGPTVFGEEPDRVDVLLLRNNPELMEMRQRVADWSVSQWPYRPHVTIGPVGSLAQLNGNIPPAIAFDRITVRFGQEDLTFWLKP